MVGGAAVDVPEGLPRMTVLIGATGILLHVLAWVIAVAAVVIRLAVGRSVDVGWAVRLGHLGSFSFLLALGLFLWDQPAAHPALRLGLVGMILAVSVIPLRAFLRQPPTQADTSRPS